MTMNAKIGGFYGFFWQFQAARQISRAIEIDMEKLHVKLSALNIDFDGSSLDFLGSRKPVHEGIKEWYSHKSRYFAVCVGQFFMKMVADRHGHAAYHNKHYWWAFQSYQDWWLWKTLNFQDKGFLLSSAIFGCSTHSKNELQWNGWR